MFQWLKWTRGEDAKIDTLIKPPVYRFTGHDESLQVASMARREQADKIRRSANTLDTRDDARSKLRMVR